MGVGRKPAVTQEAIQKRVKHTVKLKLSGLSFQEVLKEINSLAAKEGWGRISSRQLRRDFAKCYSDTKLFGQEETDYYCSLRDIHLQSMEMDIKKLNDRLNTKNDWQPYEYEKAAKILFDMKAKYAELQNWNYSKQKAGIEQSKTTGNMLEVFDRASADLQQEKPEVVQALIDEIHKVRDKLKEEEEKRDALT